MRALYYDKANLVEAFQENDAVFHKSCIAEFNKQKLSRKRKHQETFDDEEERSSNKENIRPLEICNRTSRSTEPKNDLKTVCFFCGANHRKQKLHQCLTLEVHQKVKRIAKELGDTNILSRLCEGDMVALGARYHLKCLAGFYNQYRSHERIECGNSDDDAILAGDYTFISSI